MSEVKERPIIMSAPMVRAILDGRKTVTRRVAPISDLRITPQGTGMLTWGVSFAKPIKGVLGSHSGGRFTDEQVRSIIASQFCPHGKPGDRLWVREPWAAHWMYNNVPAAQARSEREDLRPTDNRWFRADGKDALISHLGAGPAGLRGRWRPAIHMPRWASRITLEITGVRVERLQDISAEDAMAEGIEADMLPCDPVPLWRNYATGGITISPVYSYQTLWESINGRDSWVVNPWVWVISFNRLERTYGGT